MHIARNYRFNVKEEHNIIANDKNVLTFEKRPLVAELKLSEIEQFFMFSISALPQEDTFQMLTHF